MIFLISLGLGGICGCTVYLSKDTTWKKLLGLAALTIATWFLSSVGFVLSEDLLRPDVFEAVSIIIGIIGLLLLLIIGSAFAGKFLSSFSNGQAGFRSFLLSSIVIYISVHLLRFTGN